MLANKHTHRKELLWFDEKANNGNGENRPLRYATNQRSIFQDEQDGHATLAPIIFEDGTLTVSRKKPTLIKFLDCHPDNQKNGGGVFYEMDHKGEAEKLIKQVDMEFEAQSIAREMPYEQAQAIVREISGAKANSLLPSEVKLEAIMFARNNPEVFMGMLDNPTIERDNVVATALDRKIIQFRKNKSEVYWNTTKKSMLCRIPEGEDPVDALTRYLMSNDGKDDYILIEDHLTEY
jgi:hypothetical protein